MAIRRRSSAALMVALPALAYFAACTLLADNYGVRYLIPALPFVYVVAGLGVASIHARPARWRSRGCLWMLLPAMTIWPDHLPYFNELACLPSRAGDIRLEGGAACGTEWLNDSNVDWGQALPSLKEWLDRHPRPAFGAPRLHRHLSAARIWHPAGIRSRMNNCWPNRIGSLRDQCQPGGADSRAGRPVGLPGCGRVVTSEAVGNCRTRLLCL